ncbi:hypothetical protein L1887_57767 [Cichorium endivia]|nr:hypothetical protein L1887_57767 [Cichorium endivia]
MAQSAVQTDELFVRIGGSEDRVDAHEAEADQQRAHRSSHAATRHGSVPLGTEEFAGAPCAVVRKPGGRTHKDAGKVEGIAQKLEQARHLCDPRLLLRIIAFRLAPHLAIEAVPRERGQIHHRHHLHGRDFNRRQRDPPKLAHRMVVRQMRHLHAEHQPPHIASTHPEPANGIGDQRRAEQLQEARVEVEDGHEKGERDRDAVHVLERGGGQMDKGGRQREGGEKTAEQLDVVDGRTRHARQSFKVGIQHPRLAKMVVAVVVQETRPPKTRGRSLFPQPA